MHDGPHCVSSLSGTQVPPQALKPLLQVTAWHDAALGPPQVVVAALAGQVVHAPAQTFEPATQVAATHWLEPSQVVLATPEVGHAVQVPLHAR